MKRARAPIVSQSLIDQATGRAPSEDVIEQTCTDWLALDGWRSFKTSPVSNRARGVGFGEPGMADRLYLRYCGAATTDGRYSRNDETLWIEWKKLKGRAAPHQRRWIAAERSRGALVLLAGEDFPATIEGFQAWYRQSGLMRRKI